MNLCPPPFDFPSRPRTRANPFWGIRLAGRLAVAMLAGGSAFAQGGLDGLARPQEGRSMRATSSFRGRVDPAGPGGFVYDASADYLSDPATERSNHDNFTVEPGATQVLLDTAGPGVITHIWLTFLGPEPQPWAPEGAANHQEMLLRIYYDGRDRPGVEAPVGDFFANCFGKRCPVNSIPVVVEDGDSYNCFWHMPFRESIRIEVVNGSQRQIRLLYYNIDYIRKASLPEDTPYFYAQYRQEYPVEAGRDYVVLETRGKGHYVGTVLAVRTRSPAWFGEGDEKIYIDGEEKPSIWGTGTEDYFLSAWGLQTCSTLYFGVPFFDQWGIVGGHTAAYRWHIADPIVFNTAIKVTLEHWGWMSEDENPEGKRHSWNERQDDYASVAFWYQTGIPTFEARAPAARERTLPSLERVRVHAADFLAGEHHGPGRAVEQPLGWLYPRPQFFYMPDRAEDAWVAIPVTVREKEPLRLLAVCTRAPDYGRYQAYLDGVPVGQPIDLYHDRIDSRECHLLDFWPDPGTYTFKLVCIGKNPRSDGYGLGLESLRLRERRPRVAAYARDRNRDWRAHPTLVEDD